MVPLVSRLAVKEGLGGIYWDSSLNRILGSANGAALVRKDQALRSSQNGSLRRRCLTSLLYRGVCVKRVPLSGVYLGNHRWNGEGPKTKGMRNYMKISVLAQ